MEDFIVDNGSPDYDPDRLYLQYEAVEPEVPLTPLQELERDKSLVRRWLWMMPLQSVQELTVTTGLGEDRVRRLLKNLWRRGQVTRASLGRMMGVRQRWWLTTQGVEITGKELARAFPWQVTENGISWLIRRLPSVELFYAIASRLWGRADVSTPHDVYTNPDPDSDPITFTEDLELVDFQWMRDGEIHAVARYDSGAWLPLIWAGDAASGAVLAEKANKARNQLDDGLRPAGWVVACGDEPTGHLAARQWTDENALVVVPDQLAARSMAASGYTGRYLMETSLPSTLGSPEAIVNRLKEGSPMVALNGACAYQMFRFIAQWPGATPRQLEQGFGPGYRAALRPLRRSGLVERLDGGFYLTRAGILEVAHMDRIAWQSVWSRLGAYLNPGGAYRRGQQRHDRALVDVVLALSRRSYEPHAGWRARINIPGVTQIVPDICALMSQDGGRRTVFLEVEFTARTPAQIERKLEPYRLVQQHTGQGIMCLWLVQDEFVRQRFVSLGQGLPLQALTLAGFLAGRAA